MNTKLFATALAISIACTAFVAAPNASAAPRCTIKGTKAADTLRGTNRADVICGLGGNDKIIGRGGNDTIIGGLGNDKIQGDAGRDKIIGDAGTDTLTGGTGNDTLLGGGGNDTLLGGGGDDQLTGGTGFDTCLSYSATEKNADGTPLCDKFGLKLPGSIRGTAERWRHIDRTETINRGLPVLQPGDWRHCLESNCGYTAKSYCIVQENGYVENCIAFDGYGNGWADLSFTALVFGDECGFTMSNPSICNDYLTYRADQFMIDQARFPASSGMWLVEGGPVG